jgi:endonuclease YncB( thermonuclease family)
MDKPIILVVALLAAPAYAVDVDATLDALIDGDTAWFVVDGERRKVRFIGVDTPELRSKCVYEAIQATKAASYTGDALRGAARITLKDYQREADFYHRDLGEVMLNGDRNLGQELIANGLGRPTSMRRAGWCK